MKCGFVDACYTKEEIVIDENKDLFLILFLYNFLLWLKEIG